MTITKFTTISEIHKQGLISSRSFHCCLSQKLKTVDDLCEFRKHHSFHDIRNCGEKTISELELLIDNMDSKQDFPNLPNNKLSYEQKEELSIKEEEQIQDLFNNGDISARAFNCCYYNGILSLNDLMYYKIKNGSFFKLRNCGKKTAKELEDLLNTKLEFEKQKQEECDKVFNTIPPSIKDIISNEFHKHPIEKFNDKCVYYRETVNSPSDLYHIVIKCNSDFLNFYYSINKETQHNLFRLINSICVELKSAGLENSEIYDSFNSHRIMISCLNTELANELGEPLKLSSNKIDIIKNDFEAKISILSTRAKKIQQKCFSTYDQCIPYFGLSKEQFYRTVFPKQFMEKTSEELFVFIQNFKKSFFLYVTMNDDEVVSKNIANTFPFLLRMQCQFVYEYNIQYGHYPMFYITTQYLLNSDEKEDKIFSLVYGFNDGIPKTIDEIGESMNCSNESIRQAILRNKLGGIISSSEWDKYGINKIRTIFPDDNLFTNILEVEKLNISFDAFAGICKAVFPLSIKRTNGVKYLISNNLYGLKTLTKVFRSIERMKITRYSKDYLFHIEDFFKGIPDSQRNEYIDFIVAVVQKAYHLDVDEKMNIIFPQTRIDYGDILYQILKANGNPMSLNELFIALKKKIPEAKYSEPQQLRCILLNNKDIKAIGRSSTYGLKEWKHVFFGSIRDIIIQILNDSEEPIHIDRMMEQISRIYPNTNKKSVMSNLYEGQGVFTTFIHGFYGLVGKNYGKEHIAAEDSKRHTFEERFAQVKNFVQTFERLPNSTGGQEESSLFRWISRVTNNMTSTTEEQKTRFEAFMDENKNIPQNSLEYDYLLSCRRYMEFVEEHYQLPTVSNNQKLYNWFRQQKSNYFDLQGNRRLYFDNLLNELRLLEFDV